MHIIHDNLEHLSEIDKGKIEEMEKNYDSKSEELFKEIWDLSDTSEDESIVKTLGENLEKLNLQTNQESDNSETSAETVIEKKTRKLSPEKEKCEKLPESDASLSPIPRGEGFSIVHSLGMESKTKLDSAMGTEDSKTSPQNSSIKYKYGTQVIHEENCDCPYCYVRTSSKKQKLSFSINAAQMVRMFRNTKCSSSRPAAYSAEISAIPTPMVNLKKKAMKNNDNYLATIRALSDTGASIDCVEESYAKKHNLEIKPDTSNMIELINAEG